jgi:hypothetical protein
MNTRFTRRDFLRIVATIFGAGIASACERVLLTQTPKPSPTATITTMPSPTATATVTSSPSPAVTSTATPEPECSYDALKALSQVVAVEGERYEVKFPDTLDLQERAQLAINALTRCTNPESNYDVYFYGNLAHNPPVMHRLMSLYGKFWEALALMRNVTGSSVNDHVDQRWREVFLDWFHRDNPVLEGPDGGRILCWIANNYRFEENPCWRIIAEQAIETLSGAMIHRRDYRYFADEAGTMNTGWQATYQGWTLQGVTRIYSALGSLSAKTLAAEIARYLKDYAQVFESDGSFQARHPSDMGPALHFHHNGNTMVGISEYALATGDQEFAAFAKKGYEYGLSVGWPVVGFFPEYINDWPDSRSYFDCETCCTVDMIMLAINLSKLGQADYWDDVDRYVRNQFVEMQMRNGDWINQFAANYPTSPVGEGEDGDRVAERVVGSFSGWATANDYIPREGESFISGCCTGNGARALFYIWENMIEFNTGRLRIHLLLNRPSRWADVSSYVPYEGRVDVKMKTKARLEVRIPEWVSPAELLCTVDGNSKELTFRGRYALVDQLEDGSLVTITFPISERIVQTTIGNVSYTLVIKGNEVVSIDPPGRWHPFYQRAHYREGEVRWVERQCFVAR